VTVTPIVALDVPDFNEAMKLVRHLNDACSFYKVGSQLFTSAGPRIVTAIRDAGCQVFLDLKFHDIPNTVQKAAASAASIGASLITVHASGGEPMIRAAVEGAGYNCRVLAVTILTSLDVHTLSVTWDKADIDIQAEVLRLATIASDAHAAGVVCSGLEVPALHARFGHSLKLLVPGIRLPGSPIDDQSRTVTPAQAAASGASYIVLGRTVTLAPDPVATMKVVVKSLEGGDGTVG
jgi:orotidine-5'-phosphate decarboxylase